MQQALDIQRRGWEIKKVLLTVLTLNLVVSVAKIVIGTMSGTASVRADGIHSIFDSAGNLAGIIGISMAARPADANHPYGHAKFETIASLVIGLMLLVAAWEVGGGAVATLMSGQVVEATVTPLSFGIMVATLVVNVSMTAYERRAGKRLGSAVLGADSKHTLSDALVTVSVIVGLVFVHFGFAIADTIATLVVTVAICATALDVLGDVQRTFSDCLRIDPDKIRASAMEVPGVVQCHHIRTRGLENEVYADLHVLVDPAANITEAHGVANAVEAKVKARFKQVKEVMVHLEPADAQELECPLLGADDPVARAVQPATEGRHMRLTALARRASAH